MPETLKNNIKPVDLLPIQVITTTTNGAEVDTHLESGFAFPATLIKAAIGEIGNQTSTKIKIEESDDSTFGDATETVAEGGEEITVAADNAYKMEVKRTKRYLRAVVTITGGAAPTAEVHISGILCDWAKPFPILA